MVRDCTLFPAPKPGHCDGCGTALTGRQQRWCSAACQKRWWSNHDWGSARDAAIERDKSSCCRCGRPFDRDAIRADVESRLGPKPLNPQGGRAWALPREERMLLWAPYDAWKAEYRRVEREAQLEVNHIVPRVGAGYGVGCWNHLDNLETLCHPCHVEVTTKQIRQRKRAAREEVAPSRGL